LGVAKDLEADLAVAITPSVSVLIVAFEAGDCLAKCLAALTEQTVSDFEVVVIDNGSSDGVCERARSDYRDDPRFSFEFLEENLGFASAMNIAAAKAQAPWLATLNPDAFAEPAWLESLLAASQRHPGVVMFGSTQINASDRERLDGAGDHYFCTGLAWRGGFGWPVSALPPEGQVFAPCAAAAMYKRDAFLAVGGFDGDFFCYLEDVDLAFRLRLQGHVCYQVPSAVVFHVGGHSTDKIAGFARFYGTRNLLWCFVKNMPGVLFWSLFPFHILSIVLVATKTLFAGDANAFRGFFAGLCRLPWSKRKIQMRRRTVPAQQLARALVWSPLAAVTRRPMILRK
jgi:N-acetylglucosaminyl-diphospho-decaprenol L-rhamnosyltransferase